MNDLENFQSLARRTGYEWVPVHIKMCPSLAEKFQEYQRIHNLQIPGFATYLPSLEPIVADKSFFLECFEHGFKEGTEIDIYGVAHEPGSAAAFHMTKMYHPMENFDSEEQIQTYPLPDYSHSDT